MKRMHKIFSILFMNFLFLLLALSSCDTIKSVGHKNQGELISQEMRDELEDLKHRTHNIGIDVGLIEEKANIQAKEFASLQKKLVENNKLQQQVFNSSISDLSKKVIALEKSNKNASIDIRQLKTYFNEIGPTLKQYKNKISEIENLFLKQNDKIEKNVTNLREALESMIKLVKGNKTYKVQPGDSLERIARKHNTNVESIKHLNGLKNDLIVVGQELQLPD